ncbi:MAG: LysR family transcriptional regulator [Rhodospirillales bacterium]|nr:LysR family transcriptional regulator [Rhodospirillales bacterium]
MELRKLEHFLAVVEYGSIGEAARALGLTQSGLTKSIQVLEDEFGTPLLTRHTRGVEPNATGWVLAEHARLIRAQVRSTMESVENMKAEKAETISVGIVPGLMRASLVPAVINLVAKRTSVKVFVRGGFNTITLFRQLKEGVLDLVIGTSMESYDAETTDFMFLADNEQGVVVRKGHPLTRKPPRSLEDLDRFGWVLPEKGTLYRQRLEGLYVSRGKSPPRAVIESDSTNFLLSVVTETDMVGVTNQREIDALRPDDVILLDYPFKWDRATGVIYRRGEQQSDAIRELLEELRRVGVRYLSRPGTKRKAKSGRIP